MLKMCTYFEDLCLERVTNQPTLVYHIGRYQLVIFQYLNKEVTVRFGKLKMQLWDSMC
jgi:hypothetical protein